jgi:transcriptional regulator with XRE-family HTH domain/quercetin dioxygenase-like cupin family protein
VRRGISVRGLARDIGVSASLISQIETDKSQPSVSTLYAITTALGISIEDLFDLDGSGARGEVTGGDHGTASPSTRLAGDHLAGDHLAGDHLAGDHLAGDRRPAGQLPAGRSQRGRRPDQVPDRQRVPGASAQARIRDVPAALRQRAAEPDRQRRVGPVVRPAERDVLTLDSGVVWERLGQVPGTHVDFLRITYHPGGTSSSSGQLMRHSGTEYGYLLSGELILTLGFDEHRLVAGDAVSFNSTTPHGYRNEGSEPAVGIWFVLERLE